MLARRFPASAGAPEARFLLIGDGTLQAPGRSRGAKRDGLDGRSCRWAACRRRKARACSACDIYVSPHSTHMVDSKFFGSPTKIFEYMALGGGIVASDLEQIGEVLSPALTA